MNPLTLILTLLIAGVVCGGLGSAVSHHTRQGLGFLLGFLLGPIGILIAVFLKPDPFTTTPPPLPCTPAAPTRQPGALPELPDTFTIRRGTGAEVQHYGPYSIGEVMDHLASGALVPEDCYRTPGGFWLPLRNTGLI